MQYIDFFDSRRDQSSAALAQNCQDRANIIESVEQESLQQARSSVGLERFLDTEEVDGSNPFGPTIVFKQFRGCALLRFGVCDVVCDVIDFSIRFC